MGTPEVAAAKEEFQAAFDAAAAGEHAALAPVNNDVQAEQIGDSFLEDAEVEPVAVAAPSLVYPPYFAYNHVLPSAPYLAGYPYHGLAPYHGFAYNGLPVLVQ